MESNKRNKATTLTALGLYFINLEKKLGVTIETIIEATTNGIVDFEGKEHKVVFQENALIVTENDKLMYSISLKNYLKTWWLKGEKMWKK